MITLYALINYVLFYHWCHPPSSVLFPLSPSVSFHFKDALFALDNKCKAHKIWATKRKKIGNRSDSISKTTEYKRIYKILCMHHIQDTKHRNINGQSETNHTLWLSRSFVSHSFFGLCGIKWIERILHCRYCCDVAQVSKLLGCKHY